MLLAGVGAQGAGGRAGLALRGSGCAQDAGLVALAALAGLSGLQGQPRDPLVLLCLSITTGCTLQAMSHLRSLSKLPTAGGVIRG